MMRTLRQNEDLGIRLYEVNRQRAVDRAIERTRYALGADWHYLTADDNANLRWIIGEMWATVSRPEWDALRFSKLDLRAVRRLVSVGDRLRRHGTGRAAALVDSVAIVRSEPAACSVEQLAEGDQLYLA